MTPAQPYVTASPKPAPVAPTAAACRGKHARVDPDEEPPPPPPPAPGRGRRGLAENEDADVLGAEAMLALLAAESRKPLSGIGGRLDSTGSRIGLMAGGMALIAGLLLIVMVVIGSLL